MVDYVNHCGHYRVDVVRLYSANYFGPTLWYQSRPRLVGVVVVANLWYWFSGFLGYDQACC